MTTLLFDPKTVRAAIAQARAAKPDQRRATFGQYLDRGAYTDDLKEVPGGVARVNVEVEPELHLVHDEGIYLMANAWLEGEKMAIAYAVGCDPKKDGDVWQHCRDLVGGDDFCGSIPLSAIERIVNHPLIDKLAIHFSATSIGFGGLRKKAPRAGMGRN